jgi:hypothetical protein
MSPQDRPKGEYRRAQPEGTPVNAAAFFEKIRTYTTLSEEAERAWAALLRPRRYRKDESFIVQKNGSPNLYYRCVHR